MNLPHKPPDNQNRMNILFPAAFAKMTVLGHNTNDLIDCSEVIPTAPAFTGSATFPAGFTINDVEQAVSVNNPMNVNWLGL